MSKRYIAWLDGEWRVRDLEENRYIATVWSGFRRGHEQGVAERIALALNCHDDLLAACAKTLNVLTGNDPESQRWHESPYHYLYAVVAKAKGE